MLEALKRILRQLDALTQRIWPADEDADRSPPDWQLFLLALFGGLILGWNMQDFPLLGYDWLILFHQNVQTLIYYPPWTAPLLEPLARLPWRVGLALINGISIAAVSLITYRQGRHRAWGLLAAILAVFSLQTLTVLWLGHIDGYALLGILGLPWTIPLVMMKANFILFALISRRRWFVAALLFTLISLLIWPGWPSDLIATLKFRYTHPSAAGWQVTGWLPPLIGLGFLLRTNRTDTFQTIAAGSLLYPFILPYHFIVLLPAMGRLRGLRLLIAWLAAWVMLVPVAFNNYFEIYFIFPGVIWYFCFAQAQGSATWWDLIRLKLPVKQPS